MNLNLNQLETFVWVADLGSFRHAANRLNTTQPNVSTRIATLESILGTRLMDRDAGSVRLTARGQELLVHARKVLKSVESFVDAAKDSSIYDGVLKLGVTEMIAHTWLRTFLNDYKERFPNVVVELVVDLSINLERQLHDRSIDVAFQNGPFRRRTSGIRELGRYPIIWIASPSLNIEHTKKISINDLARYPILTHAKHTRTYEEVAAHFAAAPGLHPRLVSSSNLGPCIQMAVDGFGVSAVPEPMVRNELASGQLVQLKYHWVPEKLEFFARYDEHRASNVVKAAANTACDVAGKFDKKRENKRIIV